jgi:hypothetical protein
MIYFQLKNFKYIFFTLIVISFIFFYTNILSDKNVLNISSISKLEIEIRNINRLIKRNQIKKDTIITISNYGFVNFTLNWIIHLEKLNMNKFIVFCYDNEIFSLLKEKGYANRIAMVPREWLDFNISSTFSSWSSIEYNKIVQSKTNIWYHLAKLSHNFIFSDPYVVWLNKNILKHLDFLFKHSYAHALFSQDQKNRNLYLEQE